MIRGCRCCAIAGEEVEVEGERESFTRAQELRSFLFLTVVTAPVVAGIIIAGYGFAVWMAQFVVGLPGS